MEEQQLLRQRLQRDVVLAVVVARPGAPCDAAELVVWTNARVGRQQRISGVVWRDSLPRNPNGKIDRLALASAYLEKRSTT